MHTSLGNLIGTRFSFTFYAFAAKVNGCFQPQLEYIALLLGSQFYKELQGQVCLEIKLSILEVLLYNSKCVRIL